MNSLMEKGFINQMDYGSNFAYIVNDINSFLSTEYKVLQSQGSGCFVKCMKMLFNGKIQLYYLVNNYKPFASMLPNLDADKFMTIVSNLIANIIDVKSNGFLSCQNIDISFEHIYVDPNTYKVKLVYLPIRTRLFDSLSSFENELRPSLIKLINGIPELSTNATVQLATNLSNGSISLEELYSTIRNGNRIVEQRSSKVSMNSSDVKSSEMKIVAMNAPTRIEIAVNKDEFILGKKREIVDGVISFNKMISRSHCKINRNR